MKANRGSRSPLVLAAAALAILTASCSDQRIIPSPAPTPTPAPRPTQAPPPGPRLDWRDAPITPGDWKWGMEGGQSVARFADGALALRCDPARRLVTLERRGEAQGNVPMTLLTSSTTRQLAATPRPGAAPVLAVSFAGTDRILDAVAFSRGRFALETAGLPTLYVPSWPEISRVVEDCR